jgi:hypothetical protein
MTMNDDYSSSFTVIIIPILTPDAETTFQFNQHRKHFVFFSLKFFAYKLSNTRKMLTTQKKKEIQGKEKLINGVIFIPNVDIFTSTGAASLLSAGSCRDNR